MYRTWRAPWSILLVALVSPGAAQSPAVRCDAGTTVEWVVSDADSTQRDATLRMVEGLAAIDCTRLHLAGLSGTAGIVWEFACRLEGRVPAVIGFGASLPRGSQARHDRPRLPTRPPAGIFAMSRAP